MRGRMVCRNMLLKDQLRLKQGGKEEKRREERQRRRGKRSSGRSRVSIVWYVVLVSRHCLRGGSNFHVGCTTRRSYHHLFFLFSHL